MTTLTHTNQCQNENTLVHVVQHLEPGGIEALALDMLSLSPNRERVFIVSLEGDKVDALNRWPRLVPFRDQLLFMNKKPGKQIGLIYQLSQLFRTFSVDAIHTHHIGPLLYAGAAAALAGVRHRIHTEHDTWHLQNPKHRRLQTAALKLIKPVLVADANKVKQDLDSHFDYANTVVVKNGVDCNKFVPGSKNIARSQLQLPQNKIVLGCAGRLINLKGHQYAIQALSQLPKKFCLAIAGDGPEKQVLQTLAEHKGVADRLFLLGRVDDMPTFYQALDLFCLPSLKEGLPLSTLEAQACNIPTIASDVGATTETICPDSGAVVQAQNIKMLVTTIKDMVMFPSLIAPRDFVTNNFDIHNVISQYNALAKGEK